MVEKAQRQSKESLQIVKNNLVRLIFFVEVGAMRKKHHNQMAPSLQRIMQHSSPEKGKGNMNNEYHNYSRKTT